MPTSPPFVINGVTCEGFVPDDGSQTITETYGPGGPTATVLIKCPWVSRQDVVLGLLGSNRNVGRVVVRVPPLKYFNAPSDFWVCTAVNVSGIGYTVDPDTGFGFYQDAVLQCHFTVPLYDPLDIGSPDIFDLSGQAFCETSIKTSTEVFVPPTAATFYFAGVLGRPLLNSRAGILSVHFEIESVRRYMPLPIVQAISGFSGRISTQPMAFGDMNFPVGNVLFLMGEVTPTSEPATGFRLWDIPLRFLCNSTHTWNEFLNERGAYELVTTVPPGAIRSPYPVADIRAVYGNAF